MKSKSLAMHLAPLIDLEHDDLRPVADICEKRTGKRPQPGCVWRWRIKGCRGVRLECVLLQGVWQTTESAFAAFVRDQTTAAINACTAQGHETIKRTPDKQEKLKEAGLL